MYSARASLLPRTVKSWWTLTLTNGTGFTLMTRSNVSGSAPAPSGVVTFVGGGTLVWKRSSASASVVVGAVRLVEEVVGAHRHQRLGVAALRREQEGLDELELQRARGGGDVDTSLLCSDLHAAWAVVRGGSLTSNFGCTRRIVRRASAAADMGVTTSACAPLRRPKRRPKAIIISQSTARSTQIEIAKRRELRRADAAQLRRARAVAARRAAARRAVAAHRDDTMSTSDQAERYKSQGNAALAGGMFSEAVDLYTKAIHLDPDNSVYGATVRRPMRRSSGSRRRSTTRTRWSGCAPTGSRATRGAARR